MKTFLIFDTETTGLFNTKDKPTLGIKKARDPLLYPEDYPRVFQLAYVRIDDQGNILEEFNSFIEPDGWVIPTGPGNEFWDSRGYTTSLCKEKGIPMKEALEKFINSMSLSDYIVAHNLSFDKPIILAEISNYQMGVPDNFKPPKDLCTMKSTIDYVQASHSQANIAKYPFLEFSNKFPKLEELHEKLFSHGFENAHDALVDVKATFKCLVRLKELGILEY